MIFIASLVLLDWNGTALTLNDSSLGDLINKDVIIQFLKLTKELMFWNICK